MKKNDNLTLLGWTVNQDRPSGDEADPGCRKPSLSPVYIFDARWSIWQGAIMAHEEDGDCQELVALLISEEPLPSDDRHLLADLLDRRRLGELHEYADLAKLPDDILIWQARLLRSELEFSGNQRYLLATLIAKGLLKKQQGRPPTPLYQRSDSETLWLMARMEAQTLRALGREGGIKMSLGDAIKIVAPLHFVDPKLLPQLHITDPKRLHRFMKGLRRWITDGVLPGNLRRQRERRSRY